MLLRSRFMYLGIVALIVCQISACGKDTPTLAPTLGLTVSDIIPKPSSSIEVGTSLALSVNVSVPQGLTVSYQWKAAYGKVSNPKEQAVVYTSPNLPYSEPEIVTVTITAGQQNISRSAAFQIVPAGTSAKTSVAVSTGEPSSSTGVVSSTLTPVTIPQTTTTGSGVTTSTANQSTLSSTPPSLAVTLSVASVRITAPQGTLTCAKPSEPFCTFEIRGEATGVSPDWRIYTFVYPVDPVGAGWYIQRLANLRSDGTWVQSPAYLGNENYPATTGDTLEIRAVIVHKDATYKDKKLRELPTGTALDAVENIDGFVIASDPITLKVQR